MTGVAAYRAGAYLAQRAPDRLARRLVALGGSAAARGGGDRRKIVERNLERVLGRPLEPHERRRRVDAVFSWYARYYLESFQLPGLDAATVDAGFAYEGFGHIEDAVAGDVGPILVLPHLGTWEWAAFWLALVPELKVTAVVEPLEPPEVFDWFVGFRESLGMNIVPLGNHAGRAVVAALKRREVVCLLADRDVGGGGVPVDFFGERTRLPAGPATLALRTGAPLLPTAVYWHDDVRYAICGPPLPAARRGRLREDVYRVTQALADAMADLIRRAPEQWHLMSPNWPSDYTLLGRPVPDELRDLR